MRKELSALHEKIGGTMVYVTHDQVEAMTLADQIVVLNEGYVAQAGAPLDLYNNPNDTFVAGFIGSPKMNFINVKSIKKDNGINLKSECLSIKSSVKIDVDQECTLGIRPEHIYISEKEESDLEVTVDYSEQLGSETYFYCNTDGVSQLIVHQTGQYKITKGNKLFLRLDRSNMHLFGADGKAIKKNKS
jgi:multiple sugar transport system ATP-binding protein